MGFLDRWKIKPELGQRVAQGAQLKSVLSDVPITSVTDLFSFLNLRAGNESGVLVTEESALQHAAVYSCVRVLSDSFGQIPTVLKKEVGEDVTEDAVDHPLYKVFNTAPNSWMSPYEFKELAVRNRIVSGNFYAQIIRVGQRIELIPLVSNNVKPYFDESNRVKYDHTDPTTGRVRTFEKKDIFHYRGQLDDDNISGMSIIKAANSAIGLSIATQDFGSRLFKNGALYKNVFTHPTTLSQEAQDNLRKSLDSHRGEGQQGDIILEEGMTVNQVSMSAEDAQFLETRKYQRAEIAAMFNIPLHKIGDLSDAAFSNIDSQERSFQTDTMNPYYVGFQQAVARCLMTDEEEDTLKLWFMNNDALRGDTETVANIVDKRIKNGTLSPNEARIKFYNENPREGGDEFVDVTNVNTGNTAKKPEGEEDEIEDANTGPEVPEGDEENEE